MLRRIPCQEWRCVSTKPGMTMALEASMISALDAPIPGRTATILPPCTSTSAFSKSPTCRSRVRTHPPLMRMGRPLAGALVDAAGGAAEADGVRVARARGAATAPVAVVRRKRRRDIPSDGGEFVVIVDLPVLFVVSRGRLPGEPG